jgi:hypothetical protein
MRNERRWRPDFLVVFLQKDNAQPTGGLAIGGEDDDVDHRVAMDGRDHCGEGAARRELFIAGRGAKLENVADFGGNQDALRE